MKGARLDEFYTGAKSEPHFNRMHLELPADSIEALSIYAEFKS